MVGSSANQPPAMAGRARQPEPVNAYFVDPNSQARYQQGHGIVPDGYGYHPVPGQASGAFRQQQQNVYHQQGLDGNAMLAGQHPALQSAPRTVAGPSVLPQQANPQGMAGPQLTQNSAFVQQQYMVANGNPIQRLPPQSGWKLRGVSLAAAATKSRPPPPHGERQPGPAVRLRQGNRRHLNRLRSPSVSSSHHRTSSDAHAQPQPQPGAFPDRVQMLQQQITQSPIMGTSMGPPNPVFAQQPLGRAPTHEFQHPDQEPAKSTGIMSGIRHMLGSNCRRQACKPRLTKSPW